MEIAYEVEESVGFRSETQIRRMLLDVVFVWRVLREEMDRTMPIGKPSHARDERPQYEHGVRFQNVHALVDHHGGVVAPSASPCQIALAHRYAPALFEMFCQQRRPKLFPRHTHAKRMGVAEKHDHSFAALPIELVS